MNTMTRLSLAFLIAPIIATPLTSQWVQANGPYAPSVGALAMRDTVLYAGTYLGGVFRSTDKGTSWTSINNGLQGTAPYWDITSLATVGTQLFVSMRMHKFTGGVFRTSDDGASWIATDASLPSFRCMTSMQSIHFAGTWNYGVWRSTDNGDHWTSVDSGLTNLIVRALVVSKGNVFAGTEGGGVFRSTDNGISWNEANSGLLNPSVTAFADLPRSDGSGACLFAGTEGGLFRSTDDGSHWTRIDSGVATAGVRALAASYDSLGTGDRYLYALAGDSLFVSTNDGAWSYVSRGLPANVSVKAIAAAGADVYAATDGLGVYVSRNGGSTWSASFMEHRRLKITSLAGSDSLLLAGAYGSSFHAETEGIWFSGVFLSTNGGATWTGARSSDNPNWANIVWATCISGPDLFAGIWGGGVLLSTNLGTSWTAASAGLTNPDVRSLAVSGANLFAGTPGGVFLSTNQGTSWKDASTGLTNTDVRSLATDGANLFAGTGGGVFVSTNSGTSWSAASAGLTNADVRSLALSEPNLFAGTGGGVFVSTDNGTTWTEVNTGLAITDVRALAISGAHLFAGTTGGVYLTTNAGTIWRGVSNGLTDSSVRSLAVSGVRLFAGTDSGVWMRPVSEMTTSIEQLSNDRPTGFALEQNYPNPFNPETKVGYRIQETGAVRLAVYDLLGREVAVLVDEEKAAGFYTTSWNAANMASGVYFHRLTAGSFTQTRRMIVMK